ncbi:MAG: hypothetical protein AABZ15_00840 [Nitrospirota bacterium]
MATEETEFTEKCKEQKYEILVFLGVLGVLCGEGIFLPLLGIVQTF